MSFLTSLPVELVTKIVSYVSPRHGLAALRLTNKTLSVIATPFYFHTVPFYPEWEWDSENYEPFPNQIEYKASYFRNILDNDHLKKPVKKVAIYTCNPDCDHHPHWAHHGGVNMYDFMPRPDMTEEWDALFQRIPEFPKLEDVSLHMDRHAGETDDYEEGELQAAPQRISLFRELLGILDERIKKLGIRHMQLDPWNRNHPWSSPDPEVDNDLSRKDAVLQRLSALRMSVVHLQPHGESGSVYKVTECHREWASFPSMWLAPASNLRHLTIYSDIPVGWFPKLDLRQVHFAHLESLALGQFLFTNDRLFEWIIDHASTLEELYLDHCSILYQYGGSRDDILVDEEGYPTVGYSGTRHYEDGNKLQLGSLTKRWHEVFELFSASLHHLHTFRFGASTQWKFGTENRYDDGEPGMPVMAWEAETDIQNELFKDRYLIWNDWQDEYICEWTDSSDLEVIDPKNWRPEDLKRLEKYPQCNDEDERGLRELMVKIGVPGGGKIVVSDVSARKPEQY